ncbi:MAG: hypothetical protein ABI742_02635, partial [Gemmatimonadota bacterium]
MQLTLLTSLLLGLTSTHAAPPGAYPDGEALISAMHDRYAGKWYNTLTFVQTTTLTKPALRSETWYEAARIPGMLRIDIAPLDSANTLYFRNDSVYRVAQGKLRGGRPFVHPLMVLGFDVYADPIETTLGKLKGLGFDLSKIREGSWQGRRTYIVGAAEGDTTSAQFWIDRERLVFVRMLEPSKDGKGGVEETQFNRYQKLGLGWIAIEVTFTVNGELLQKEEYADARADVVLPDGLFDP